jgi:hypothetical protein
MSSNSLLTCVGDACGFRCFEYDFKSANGQVPGKRGYRTSELPVRQMSTYETTRTCENT